jgi:translation initiation factor IF-2
MSKVRAYKIAEELGIEKEELLKRAADAGIALKSAMVALDEEQAAELRKKLGSAVSAKLVEQRVAGGVIRRRKKAAGAEAEPAPAAVAPAEEPPVVEGGEEPPTVPVEIPPVVAPTPESVEAPAPLAAQGAAPVGDLAQEPGRTTRTVEAPGEVAGAVRAPGRTETTEPARAPRRPVRRQALETANLREQETLARQMRGNVQHQLERRRQLVEQQSRIQSRRRRSAPAAPARKVAVAGPRRKLLKLAGPISFTELSAELGVKVHELLRRVRGLGVELERDDMIEVETAELVATEFGFEVQHVDTSPERQVAAAERAAGELPTRPPVVTVMGHVDHGKTSLLDFIRRANVAAGEAGGITQHIGAYQVEGPSGRITFLDTPGHAAFTQMRARGAQVTDIAVLVVAADDGIMPQTIEALSHARAAGVPIIVAINKIDKPEANIDRVKRGLLEQSLVPEDLGGETICVPVSATKGTNVDRLLEMINLQAEVLELSAPASGPARGVVIEAQLDKGRGPVATVLIREGLLERGDPLVVGTTYGRVRALISDRGEELKQAGPSTPVRVIGLAGVPESGDEAIVVKSERDAKALVEHRLAERKRAASGAEAPAMPAAEALFAQLEDSEKKQLRVVLKADVHGTMEAIRDALADLSTERVKLTVLHAGVGAISESDVMLAAASRAIVVGFHVRPEAAARRAAEREHVELRTSDIVYELIDDMRAAMAGLLPPRVVEKVTGHAEVRQLFPIPRIGTVAGCAVAGGAIRRSDRIRVVRDGVPVYTGKLASLRRFKEDVREVVAPLECGIGIENFNDVKVGDVLEAFSVEETPDTL